MPGRSYTTPAYRYGFNGKENDSEIKGITGSQQDYGMRIYDPRLGKFLSVDPITATYPELTPYQFASNTPIQAIDLDGLEGIRWLGDLDEPGFAIYEDYNGGLGLKMTMEHLPYSAWAFTAGQGLVFGGAMMGSAESFSIGGSGGAVESEVQIRTGPQETQSTPKASSIASGETTNVPGQVVTAVKTVSKSAVKLSSEQEIIANNEQVVTIRISKSKFPESAQHIEEAQNEGLPKSGVLDRTGASKRRYSNLKNMPTSKGKDRDEYPPAVVKTATNKSSIRLISPPDNRGSGASIMHQIKGVEDGTTIQFEVCE